MNNKVIEEVDENLEGDLSNKQRPHGLSSIRNELSSTTRQVDKIINKMGYRHIESDKSNQQSVKKKNTGEKEEKKSSAISKYNYYGKRYRFQQKEEELHIEPPIIQRSCCTEKNQPEQPHFEKTAKSEHNIDFSNQAQPTDNMFYGDGKIQFPSQNYYIYFDNLPKSVKKSAKSRPKKSEPQYNESVVPQKFKPAWLMEKKINALQRELKQMKEREKKLGATMESVMLQSGSSSFKHRKTVDFPIHIKSNVERMVESLWK